MKIIKKVLVKQIVTEKSKVKLGEKFTREKMQLEQECQQLLFEQRKLQNKPGVSKQNTAQLFKQEITKRKEEIKLINFKVEQLDILKIGSEIIEKEVEALVEVSEGLHWSKVMSEKAIIVKDDIVVRIDR